MRTLVVVAALTGCIGPGLQVVVTGEGDGVVGSSPDDIHCGEDCATIVDGPITLTATPGAGSTFGGWSGGGCSGTETCTLRLTEDVILTARFDITQLELAVALAGTGTGSVVSDPAGIACGADCTEAYPAGSHITLTAAPDPDSTFAGWTGGCTGTSPTCTVTLAEAQLVTASFTARNPQLLTVTRSGTGTGSVTSSPTGIDCGADCSEAYPYNTVVSLVATPATGSTFVGWGGGICAGTGTCTITVDQARSVSAQFNHIGLYCTYVSSMLTNKPGGIYTNWLGAWSDVTSNTGGERRGYLLPYDEPNTPTVESQYYFQESMSATPSVLAIGPNNSGFIPDQILTVVSNSGTLAVYMPSLSPDDCVRTRLYVGTDGSTYHSRADHTYTYSPAKENIFTEQCFGHGVVGPDLTPEQAMVPAHLARAAGSP